MAAKAAAGVDYGGGLDPELTARRSTDVHQHADAGQHEGNQQHQEELLRQLPARHRLRHLL